MISVALLIIPAAGICYLLLQSGRAVFRAAAAATRKHPVLRVPLAAAAIAAGAGLAASWGLLPLPADHLAATDRPSPSVSPSPILVVIPTASGVRPSWPTEALDRPHRAAPRGWCSAGFGPQPPRLAPLSKRSRSRIGHQPD